MKVLCTCVPGFGHFHPMVPLAQAMRRAGHDIAFATAERFCRRVVEPSGFSAFGAGMSPPAAFEQTIKLFGGSEPSEEELWRFGARMFAEVAAPAKVGDLVRVIQAWGADLVVHDMTDFAGPVAAAACGVPWACHSFGALQPAEFWDLAADAVGPTWAAWGVEPGRLGGMFRSLYLDLCPRGLQSAMIDQVPAARPLRPVTFDNPSGQDPPGWLGELADAPTIYVTLPAGELGVCHGGSGTTLAALGHGLPLLALPQEANQFWNADRIVALGAGELLRPSHLTADAVHAAVARLLGDPAYLAQAGLVAAEIAAMPTPDDVVPTLEELASGRSRP